MGQQYKLPTVFVASKMTSHFLSHLTANYFGGSFPKVSLKSNYSNLDLRSNILSFCRGKKKSLDKMHISGVSGPLFF